MAKATSKPRNGKQTPRRHTGQPGNLESLVQANPKVICPHCLKYFSLAEAPIIPHGRTCPRCGSSIKARGYESRRAQIKNRARNAEQEAAPYRQKRDEYARKQFETRWKIAKWFYLQRIKSINKRYGSIIAAADETQHDLAKLNDFAKSEYYTSDWFTYSGRALAREGMGPLRRYRLSVGYAEGRLDINAASGGGFANGIVAEWRVYDLLERAIARGKLPAETILCPNVFIRNPNADEQEFGYASGWGNSGRFYHGRPHAPRPLYNQLDLVAITQNAIIVFEVKRRRASIAVDRQENISVIPGNKTEPIDITRDKRQCENHAAALANKFPTLSFDQIYEATVYVDTLKFETQQSGFANNAGVFCIDTPHQETFLGAIESCLITTADPAPIDRTTLNTIANTLRNECADQNSRKEYLHLERIETIKSYRESR